jgi:IclR family acetate operon transcriptional repressor
MMGSATESGTESGTEAARRVADVLLVFASEPNSIGVSEIARRLDLSKAVVHRILRSLASRNLVTFDGGTRGYKLGPAAAAIGARALRDRKLRQVALPVLRRLQHETGETTTVSELVGTARVYLDQIPSLKEVKMTVELGRPFPLHAGASSKAILAFAPFELRRLVLAGPLVALTPNTITERLKLEEELLRTEQLGTAVSFGERQPGAASVAAPVCGMDGHAVGAISACGPIDRFDEEMVERLRPLVRSAARETSGKVS